MEEDDYLKTLRDNEDFKDKTKEIQIVGNRY